MADAFFAAEATGVTAATGHTMSPLRLRASGLLFFAWLHGQIHDRPHANIVTISSQKWFSHIILTEVAIQGERCLQVQPGEAVTVVYRGERKPATPFDQWRPGSSQ